MQLEIAGLMGLVLSLTYFNSAEDMLAIQPFVQKLSGNCKYFFTYKLVDGFEMYQKDLVAARERLLCYGDAGAWKFSF